VDSTPLGRSEQEGGYPEPGGSGKGDGNGRSCTNDVPLHRRIGREEVSSNRSGPKSRHRDSGASARSDRVGEDLLGISSRAGCYRYSTRPRRPPFPSDLNRTIL
jgi:hypothetical protein